LLVLVLVLVVLVLVQPLKRERAPSW